MQDSTQRYGAPPSLVELVKQHELMVSAFETKRVELQKSFSQPLNLSLKKLPITAR